MDTNNLIILVLSMALFCAALVSLTILAQIADETAKRVVVYVKRQIRRERLRKYLQR